MTADKVMPHSTVAMGPSGEYVVLVEGDPVPDWFVADEPKSAGKAPAKTAPKSDK